MNPVPQLLSAKTMLTEGDQLYISQKTYVRSMPLHWHDFYEVQIVLDGELTQIINGTTYVMHRGSMYLLNPYDVHEYYSENPVQIVKIQFDISILNKDLMQRICAGGRAIIVSLSEEQLQRILQLTDRILYEHENNLQDGKIMMYSLLDCVICEIMRMEQSQSESTLSNPIMRALQYIYAHYTQSPSLNKVANVVFLSANYFCSLFKKEVGLSYKQYLKNLQLKRAKTLLATTDITVSQACTECGYTSFSHFMSDFKEFVGMTPNDFRKKIG